MEVTGLYGKTAEGGLIISLSVESRDNQYISHKLISKEGKREDFRILNGKRYHYGESPCFDRVFSALHALWLQHEKDMETAAKGDNAAFWRVKKALEQVSIR